MVFVIPEDRPNPANEAISNILGLLEQQQGARELASLMGLNRREFAAQTPQAQQFQMQQYLQGQQDLGLANLLGLQMPAQAGTQPQAESLGLASRATRSRFRCCNANAYGYSSPGKLNR